MPARQEVLSHVDVTESKLTLYSVGDDAVGLNFNKFFDNTHTGINMFTATINGLTTAFPDTEFNALDVTAISNNAVEAPVSRNSLLAELQEIRGECSIDGWDTQTSKAITSGVFDITKQLITLFPPYLIDPEITPENDGVLGLEWRGANGYFDIAVTSSGIIFYIAKIHNRKHRGSFEHDSSRLPVLMQAFLDQVFSEE